MWYGPNLQRSYKYMMFASKMPSLRIDQSDLKCKNGCDYFGNPQWQGYCSRCHREQMQKQRRAEKASSTSATLPRPEPRKPERGLKPTSHSSFSKFEEKRLRQSETLKKANLLKFNTLFKKSNSTTEENDYSSEKRTPEFKIPSQVNEHMKADFRIRFSRLSPHADRDARVFVHTFIMDVMKCHSVMTVDELSERVQRQYQHFMKHMDTSSHFADVDSETKERLMDFVEKHAMTYLHDLPSIVFSPHGTDDERLDRAMSERIQQLSWVCERHLECKLDRSSPDCRRLLYKAISELLGMDSATSPGGKLARVRRCCRHVLALCGAPASADDLLPALIFTVLKANPPRLTSNINFVTRFCNAQRLMTGEGGYYFTNLCCAVSFIENLNAESLNMDKKEFDCYMAMPASIGGSSWAAALSLCGAAREAEEQRQQICDLLERTQQVQQHADKLASDADTFEEQISKKVQDMLMKTPLEIKPRRELPRIGKLKKLQSEPLIDIGSSMEEPKLIQADERKNEPQNPVGIPQIQHETSQSTPTEEEPKLNILGFEVIERESPSKSPQNLDQWELKQTNSLELLTPSPLGFTPFDSRSIDELMTPDDFVTDNLAPGLSNINYDIDLSDFSADNSIAEDAPKSQDPFSPDGLKKEFDPFAPQTSREKYSKLEAFDEFSLVNKTTNKPMDPFEVVHRSQDPFSPEAMKKEFDPFAPITDSKANIEKSATSDKKDASILDAGDSPTGTCLLPSPLQPQMGKPT